MKIFIILFFGCLVCAGQANFSLLAEHKNVSGSGGSCVLKDTNYVTTGNASAIGDASNHSVGFREFLPTANYSICKIGMVVQTVVGNVSAINYVIKIYNTNGASCNLGNTLLATSDTVTGLSSGTNDFTFSTPLAVNTTTHYDIQIVRQDGGDDGSNFVTIEFATSGGTLIGSFENWLGSVCQNGAPTTTGRNPIIRIYGQ